MIISPIIFTNNGAGGGGLGKANAFTESKVVFIRSNGNNATAVKGRSDLPFLTANAAFLSIPEGERFNGSWLFDFGIGTFTLDVTAGAGSFTLRARGAGVGLSSLAITSNGLNSAPIPASFVCPAVTDADWIIEINADGYTASFGSASMTPTYELPGITAGATGAQLAAAIQAGGGSSVYCTGVDGATLLFDAYSSGASGSGIGSVTGVATGSVAQTSPRNVVVDDCRGIAISFASIGFADAFAATTIQIANAGAGANFTAFDCYITTAISEHGNSGFGLTGTFTAFRCHHEDAIMFDTATLIDPTISSVTSFVFDLVANTITIDFTYNNFP